MLVTPSTAPFCRNSTLVIEPSVSLAVAVNVIAAGAVKLPPLTGAVIATVGEAFGPLTVIGKYAESACPFVSVAVAVTE
jgi:hypothetical protein